MTSPHQAISPERFFETINSFQKTAVLKGAIDLELFTAIAEGHSTAPRIAERCDASPRGTRILCDYLVIMGFLTKTDSTYALTPDSAAFLNRRSPMYLGGAVGFLLSPTIRSAFDDVAALVRAGGTTLPKGGSMAPEHSVWVDFARCMAPMMMPAAEFIATLLELGDGPAKVLDIAAGHGVFGVTIARHAPNAEIVAVDWPAVLEVANENAMDAGVADRYTTLPGNAFDVDFGKGYDVVLLTNFLHHFDPPTCVKLLEKVRASLAEGGRVVTLEFVPNEDRLSPPAAAAFSMMMLASTPGGDAYTFAEFERMLADAGFSHTEHHRIPPGIQSILLTYK